MERVALREKILQAVNQLIEKGGFEGLSMRKIAEAIDYSPTTIYRFFKNKNELLGAITDRTYADLSRKFESWNKNTGIHSLDKLQGLIREYIRFGLTNPNIYRIYVHLCKLEVRDGGMYETIGNKTYRIFPSWQRLIGELVSNGSIKGSPDPIALVLLIWHTADGFILNRIKHPGLPWRSDEEEIQQLMKMIFKGILNHQMMNQGELL